MVVKQCNRSKNNAIWTRTSSQQRGEWETPKEISSMRILADDEGRLLNANERDSLNHRGCCNNNCGWHTTMLLGDYCLKALSYATRNLRYNYWNAEHWSWLCLASQWKETLNSCQECRQMFIVVQYSFICKLFYKAPSIKDPTTPQMCSYTVLANNNVAEDMSQKISNSLWNGCQV